MSNTIGHEPAFASSAFSPQDDIINQIGLTKREYFAALALQGLCFDAAWDKRLQQQCEENKTTTSIAIATYAVDLADALIDALNKQ